jgi:hypothetical protein
MFANIDRQNLNKTIAMSLILFLISSISYCNTEEGIKLEIKSTKDVYIIGEPINIEVKFKNCTKWEMHLYKHFTPLETFWEIRIFDKDLRRIDEYTKIEDISYSYKDKDGKIRNVTKLRYTTNRSSFTPLGGKENRVYLRPGEEHFIQVDISKDQFISKLEVGKYKIRMVYIGAGLITIVKEKVEYYGKGDIESNEIELKLGDKELQGFLKENPSADLNKDGILTYEEKNKYLESLPKEEKKQ